MTKKKVPNDDVFYEEVCEYLDEYWFTSEREVEIAVEDYYLKEYCTKKEWFSYWEMIVLHDFAKKYIEEKHLVFDEE